MEEYVVKSQSEYSFFNEPNINASVMILRANLPELESTLSKIEESRIIRSETLGEFTI